MQKYSSTIHSIRRYFVNMFFYRLSIKLEIPSSLWHHCNVLVPIPLSCRMYDILHICLTQQMLRVIVVVVFVGLITFRLLVQWKHDCQINAEHYKHWAMICQQFSYLWYCHFHFKSNLDLQDDILWSSDFDMFNTLLRNYAWIISAVSIYALSFHNTITIFWICRFQMNGVSSRFLLLLAIFTNAIFIFPYVLKVLD